MRRASFFVLAASMFFNSSCAEKPKIILHCEGIEESPFIGPKPFVADLSIDEATSTILVWNDTTGIYEPRVCEDCVTEISELSITQNLRSGPAENSLYIDRMTGDYAEKLWEGDPRAEPIFFATGTCEVSDPPLEQRAF